MKHRLAYFLVIVAVLTISLPLCAHHGNAAFDSATRMTVKGIVVNWLWASPHSVLTLDVKDDKGQAVRWAVEGGVPTSMSSNGWGRNSFKAGDEVTVTLTPAKNGRPIGRIEKVVLANGQTLLVTIPPDSPTEKPKGY